MLSKKYSVDVAPTVHNLVLLLDIMLLETRSFLLKQKCENRNIRCLNYFWNTNNKRKTSNNFIIFNPQFSYVNHKNIDIQNSNKPLFFSPYEKRVYL